MLILLITIFTLIKNVFLNVIYLESDYQEDEYAGFSWNTTISGHSHYVTSLIQLSNGMLLSGSYDNSIRV